MDSSNRRPQLPPMGYLDHDKARRDEDVYQDRLTGAPQVLPPPPAASPAHQYPSGPPPPYSHPAPPSQYMSNITSSTPANVHTPPESRRTSENEKEAIKQTVRHSLPSISEALGVETKPIYRPTLPVQTTPSSTHALPPTHGLASSPSPRSHGMEPPQQPSEQHTAPTSHFAQYRQDAQRHPSYPSADAPRPSYADSRPPVHMPAARSPPPQRSAHHPSQYAPTPTPRSPAHEQPPQHPPGAMGPPSFPYGYQPYPSRYAAAAPPPPAPAAGPIYQPSLSNAAPSSAPTPWKAENARYGGEERTYGDSVKRQLEMYDLAGALSDISATSGIMTDFARRYGDRLHQTTRSGPTPSTLPGLVEVEDMINKARVQVDCLTKIREVVVAQQVAYDQQAAEQRQQQKAYAEPTMSAMQHEDDIKCGFAGSDPKKRRGRAAPPGRCHSCNRAETPEWRRGPDGARTLCNACGLHYAKLTRKEKNANKNAAVNNSNLRPKESMS
ncbi:hypothetical protein Q7P36_005328 [Cladosporium allicinum]